MHIELASMDKLFKAKDLPGLWAHIEAWATFVPHNCDEWFMSDDSDGIKETLRMIGGALISTLNMMDKEKLLVSDSTIPDIALVLAQMRDLAQSWPSGSGEPEVAWGNAAILKVAKSGVIFKDAPYGVHEVLEEISFDPEDSESEIDEPDAEIRYRELNWNKEFVAFKRNHSGGSKLGGDHYVLTKKKKASEKRAGVVGRSTGFAITLGPGEDVNDFL